MCDLKYYDGVQPFTVYSRDYQFLQIECSPILQLNQILRVFLTISAKHEGAKHLQAGLLIIAEIPNY